MGNTTSSPPSLSILKIKESSPAHKAGFLPFINIITHINDLPANLDILKNINSYWQTQEIKFLVKDIRTDTDKVVIIPKKIGEQTLGMSVTLNDTNFNLCYCILEVEDDSPAFHAGLIENQDFIIGIENVNLKDEDDFFGYLYRNAGKKINLIVCNTGMLNLRIAELVPQKDMLLGCEVGSGILYNIPDKELFFDFNCNTTRKGFRAEDNAVENGMTNDDMQGSVMTNDYKHNSDKEENVLSKTGVASSETIDIASVDLPTIDVKSVEKMDVPVIEVKTMSSTVTEENVAKDHMQASDKDSADVTNKVVAEQLPKINAAKEDNSTDVSQKVQDSGEDVKIDQSQGQKNDVIQGQENDNVQGRDLDHAHMQDLDELYSKRNDVASQDHIKDIKDKVSNEITVSAQNTKSEKFNPDEDCIIPEYADNLKFKPEVSKYVNVSTVSHLCEKVNECEITKNEAKEEVCSESDENYKCYEINNKIKEEEKLKNVVYENENFGTSKAENRDVEKESQNETMVENKANDKGMDYVQQYKEDFNEQYSVYVKGHESIEHHVNENCGNNNYYTEQLGNTVNGEENQNAKKSTNDVDYRNNGYHTIQEENTYNAEQADENMNYDGNNAYHVEQERDRKNAEQADQNMNYDDNDAYHVEQECNRKNVEQEYKNMHYTETNLDDDYTAQIGKIVNENLSLAYKDDTPQNSHHEPQRNCSKEDSITSKYPCFSNVTKEEIDKYYKPQDEISLGEQNALDYFPWKDDVNTAHSNAELLNILSQNDEECAFDELVEEDAFYANEIPENYFSCTNACSKGLVESKKEVSLSDEGPENGTNEIITSPTQSDPGAFDVKKFDDLRNEML